MISLLQPSQENKNIHFEGENMCYLKDFLPELGKRII